jgi:hypothetical protein
LGGFHVQVQSNATDGVPSVEKSPINCTFELFCRFGFAWNSRVIRLSSSLEFDAWAKVRPVRDVSATSGRDVATPFTVEPAVFPVCVCRRMKVKLKISSSSFDRRSRNVGTAAEGGMSVSCDGEGQPPGGFGLRVDRTWIYSIGVSSPASRFAVNLAAGNALGARVSSRRLELLIVIDATETRYRGVHQHGSLGGEDRMKRTPILVLKEQVSRVVQTAGDIAHGGRR